MRSIIQKLFQPVDNSPLIFFRIGFGFLILAEAWGAIATGWVKNAFITPQFTFTFMGFEWLQPLPGNGMYYYYGLMGVAGLMVMLGYYYRVGMSIYTVMWTCTYLGQKTNYNNHYYLLVLLCFLMIFMPAHRYYSLDAKRKPELKSLVCPQWCHWAFITQMFIVYTYASIAKMYPDWLMAKPVGIWFEARADWPIIGPVLGAKWVQWVVAYGGIAFDMLVAPALIWKKTRKWAFAVAIFFHLFNSLVFHIGIFPYMGILLCVFFFPPESIRKLFLKIGRFLSRLKINITEKPSINLSDQKPYPINKWLLYFFAVWFVIQVGLPLRHWRYEGNVHWTEEGHRLSWRMMLRVKHGYVRFLVQNKETGEKINVSPTQYLTKKQARVIATRPDMCWQFVQFLKGKFVEEGKTNIEIYAIGKVSLNGSKYAHLYNPKMNLADQKWERFKPAEWLVRSEKD